MISVRRHYDGVAKEISCDRPMHVDNLNHPLVIVPIDSWTRITEKGLRFAMKLSDRVEGVHVDAEEVRGDVEAMWQRNVVTPIEHAGLPVPKLVFLPSPYRFVLMPLINYVLQLEQDHHECQIAVLVPELVVKHWWQTPLHNQRAQLLKLLLLVRGNPRITVINIPWYL
jgi:hypothetical protein